MACGGRRRSEAERLPLEHDAGTRGASAAAAEEETHAERFSTLHGDQAHLAANVVRTEELCHHGFVAFGVALEALNAIEDALAKLGANLDGFVRVAFGKHKSTL